MTTPGEASRGRSDRRESIYSPVDARVTLVVPGVELTPLVSTGSGADNLFTGLLSLAPRSAYPLYSRPCAEALMLVDGEAAVQVQDRSYRLGPLDTITVSPGVPRRVVNLSAARPAIFQAALATSIPVQTWVNGRFSAVEQPTTASGVAGFERLVRKNASAQSDWGPLARFQVSHVVELGTPGIRGGYGLFEPGARLPCHRHEFDEAITIARGTATCIVEGRRHDLTANTAALIPTDSAIT